MATNKSHSVLLECSRQYELYFSPGLSLEVGGTLVPMPEPVGGLTGSQHALVKPSLPGGDQVTAIVGYDKDGKKAVFLVRLPTDVQIFPPNEETEAGGE